MKKILYVELEADGIEERSSFFERHQEVEIAVRAILTSGRGAEDPDVRSTSAGGKLEDLLAVPFEC